MLISFENCENLMFGITEVNCILHFEITEKTKFDFLITSIVSSKEGFEIIKNGKKIEIYYNKKVEFFRALALFIENLNENKINISQKPSFKMNCYMQDNARNAVVNFDFFKKEIRFLALMGIDSYGLYLEDLIKIPEYPYFGHMRGRFSNKELIEYDEYAAAFGIELIAFVQTLAHLNAITCWPCFNEIFDCHDILLCDEDKTYLLIKRMLTAVKNGLKSTKICIGMDEAHFLGLGKHLDKYGYENQFEIFNRHLKKVNELCIELGYNNPMIWSDMYFRIASPNNNYYDTFTEIPQSVMDAVPKNITLLYWDYYHHEEDIYLKILSKHKKFNNNIGFAGGIFNWIGFVPRNVFSMSATRFALKACKEKNIDTVIATNWGDDGAEAPNISILPVLMLYAESCYSQPTDDENLAKRMKTCTSGNFYDFLDLDLGDRRSSTTLENSSKTMLYTDLLLGLYDKHIEIGSLNKHYKKSSEKLLEMGLRNPEFEYMFENLAALYDVMSIKIDLGAKIKLYYDSKDNKNLRNVADEVLPLLLKKINYFHQKMRIQWYKENKSFGFDVLDIRIGGLKERINTVIYLLNQYLNGEIFKIEELEEKRLFADCRDDNSAISELNALNNWTKTATSSVIFNNF